MLNHSKYLVATKIVIFHLVNLLCYYFLIMTKKIILVTGGAGLIGSHLIEELVKDPNNEVISLDNYFIGKKSSHIQGATYLTGHTKDMALIVDTKPDLIYHLAEYSRVEQSFSDIKKVWELNVAGTFAVLEFWRHHGCKLVYAGSSTKFANEGAGRHQSPYAWMKATNTELVQNFANWFSLPYAITYFYNNYGARELSDGPYASVIGRFKALYRAGKPLPVIAPGTQKRNFTYVKDTVRALLLVGENGEGDGYGIGSDEAISIGELAKMFTDQIEMLPEHPGNRLDAPVENERVKQEFGWQPEMTVRQYITELKDGQRE